MGLDSGPNSFASSSRRGVRPARNRNCKFRIRSGLENCELRYRDSILNGFSGSEAARRRLRPAFIRRSRRRRGGVGLPLWQLKRPPLQQRSARERDLARPDGRIGSRRAGPDATGIVPELGRFLDRCGWSLQLAFRYALRVHWPTPEMNGIVACERGRCLRRMLGFAARLASVLASAGVLWAQAQRSGSSQGS